MAWTNFFDFIFVINLKRRSDRLLQIKWELDKYNIKHIVWEANERTNGQEGIASTLKDLFKAAIYCGLENILVFEDDAKFMFDPSSVMEGAIKMLPSNYDMLYLGVNPTKTYVPRFYSTNLLYLPRGYALHACAYSLAGMKKILELPDQLPIDLNIADNIHPEGNSYAVYPMICTQRPGFSDIEKKYTDWSFALENRFNERLNLLLPQYTTNEQTSSEGTQEKGS